MKMPRILRSRNARNSLLLLIPALIVVFAVSLYPLLRGIFLGFTNYKTGKAIKFNGLENYVYLTKSGYFWPSLWRQFLITFGSMLITYAIGLPLALALNSDIPMKRLFRILIVVPWATPPLVKIAAWENMYSSSNGWINAILRWLGLINKDILWLGEPRYARICVMIMIAWGCIPYLTLMSLATLQGVPLEHYEAAKIDGATPIQEFFYVTLPHLKQILVVSSSFLFIWIANDFTSQYTLTGGGPGSSTLTLIVEAYRQGFERGKFGLACAYGNLMICFMSAFLIVYLTLINRKGEK